jgi:membrane protein
MLALLGDVPIGVADPLRAELRAVLEADQPGLLSVGILGAVWAATAGMNAFIQAMDRAYRVPETRPGWLRFLLALGLTIVAGTGLVGAFLLLMVSEVAGPRLARLFGLLPLYQAILSPGRWLVIGLVVVASIATVYRAAPNHDVPWRRALPGALLFTLGWSLATYAFSLYVASFGSYSATYGTLGGAAILLIWFYASSLLLLAGAELNASLEGNQRGRAD